MGIYSDYIIKENQQVVILENKIKSQKKISNNLPIFYTHMIKYVSLTQQSTSWLRSIYESIKQINEEKKEEPAAYKSYSIQDNMSKIKLEIDKILYLDNSNTTEFDYSPLNIFNSLDIITDINYVNQYLLENAKSDKIKLSIKY